MQNVRKWAFTGGLVLAVVAAFIEFGWFPWMVAGLGLLIGFVNVNDAEIWNFLIAAVGVVVALISIQAQHYNPQWLTNIVFYVKVFVSHALLLVAVFQLFKTAKD